MSVAETRIMLLVKRNLRVRLIYGASVIFGLALACPASVISLGDAASYTALALNGSHVYMGNATTTVNGDFGIAANAQGFLDKGTVTGTMYVDPTASVSTGSAWNGTKVVQAITQAVSDAIDASSAFAALSTNRPDVTVLNNSITITGNGSDNVFSLSAVNLSSKTVTLTGTADDYFIFNVMGGFWFSSSTIALSGGVQTSHVLFNVVGSTPGTYAEFAGSGTFRGTLLAPDRAIKAGHMTIEGQFIGGGDSTFSGLTKDSASFVLHSEQIINYVPWEPVPEPATLGLLALGGMGVLLRRRRMA